METYRVDQTGFSAADDDAAIQYVLSQPRMLRGGAILQRHVMGGGITTVSEDEMRRSTSPIVHSYVLVARIYSASEIYRVGAHS